MDGFHLLIYDGTATSTSVNADLNAATDPVFTQRNNHITLTDDLKLIAAQAIGANVTRMTIRAPTWNAQTIWHIEPLNVSSLQLSPPRIMDLASVMPTIPQDEEIQCQVTDLGAANDTVTVGLWVGTPGWNRNIPKGIGPLSIFSARVTATPTLANRAWSALTTLTFEQSLRAGIYALCGAHFYQANCYFVRFQFPRSTLYNGRALRPGYPTGNTLGDLPYHSPSWWNWPFGVAGKFHTFELPQVEFWSQTSSSSATVEGRLFLVKLSETTDPSFLSS